MRKLDYGKMGLRIRQVRKARGWSQEELAKKCSISMSFLGHIERGTRIMSMETFVNICSALDAGADELLWGIANPSDALLDMWNLPEKKKVRDKEKDKDKDKDKRNRLENQAGKAGSKDDGKKTDSYAMYVKIMKSVAEIMNEA